MTDRPTFPEPCRQMPGGEGCETHDADWRAFQPTCDAVADSPNPEGAEPRDQWAQRWADFVERVSNEDRLDTDSRRTLMDYGHAAAIAAEALGRVNGRREAALPEPSLDVERLALYMHQARTSNDEPIYDMDEARRRADTIAARLRGTGGAP